MLISRKQVHRSKKAICCPPRGSISTDVIATIAEVPQNSTLAYASVAGAIAVFGTTFGIIPQFKDAFQVRRLSLESWTAEWLMHG